MVSLIDSKQNFTIALKEKEVHISELLNKAQHIANQTFGKEGPSLPQANSDRASQKATHDLIWILSQMSHISDLPDLPKSREAAEFDAIMEEKKGQPGYKNPLQTMQTLLALDPKKWEPIFKSTDPASERLSRRAELSKKFVSTLNRMEMIALKQFNSSEFAEFDAIMEEKKGQPGYKNPLQTMQTLLALDPKKWEPVFKGDSSQFEEKKRNALQLKFDELRNLLGELRQVDQEIIDNL